MLQVFNLHFFYLFRMKIKAIIIFSKNFLFDFTTFFMLPSINADHFV
jgi:hypothetical protein